MTSHSSHDHCSVVCQMYTEEPRHQRSACRGAAQCGSGCLHHLKSLRVWGNQACERIEQRVKRETSSHVICGKATDRHEPDLLPSALRRLEARWIRCMSARQVLKGDARWLWTTNHHALALDNQGCHIRHLRMRPESAGRSRPQSASVIARPGSGRDSPVRRGREIPTHPFGQSEANSTFKPKKREA